MATTRKKMTGAVVLGACLVLIVSPMISAESGEHPCILFYKKEIPMLRERIKHRPWSDWYDVIRKNADELLAADIAKIRGYAARWGSVRLAFVYSITGDRKYADKAKDILMAVDVEYLKTKENKLHLAYSGISYPVAYDMIYPALTPSDRESIKKRLVYAIEQLQGPYNVPNIWVVRAEGAGLAGLAFDRPNWVEGAKHAFRTVFGGVKEGGGYQEGQGYGDMAAVQINGFLLALKRSRGENLFDFPKYREFLTQSVLSLSPLGTVHRFEDSDLGSSANNADVLYTCAANVSSPDQAGLYLWGYNKYIENHAPPDRASVFNICMPNELPTEANAPKVTSWVIPKSGLAFLRNGWGNEDLYLAMTCKPYSHHPHEHRDETSFDLWAYGALLLANPGYPGWAAPHHLDWAVTTEASNTIKINGKEQHGTAANGYSGYLVDGPVEYVSGDGSRLYPGARFIRNIIFVKPGKNIPGYFVLLDNIKTASPTDQVDWIIHGRGSVTLTDQRAVWTVSSFTDKKPVSLTLELLSPKATIAQKEGWMAFEKKNVPYIKARHVGSADYLAILYPTKDGQSVPSIARGETTLSATIGLNDFFFARHGDGNIKAAGLLTDARFCFVRKGRSGLDSYLVSGATKLEYGGKVWLEASAPVDASLALKEAQSWGIIKTSGAARVKFHAPTRLASLTIGDKALTFTYSSGMASFSVEGPCRVLLRE